MKITTPGRPLAPSRRVTAHWLEVQSGGWLGDLGTKDKAGVLSVVLTPRKSEETLEISKHWKWPHKNNSDKCCGLTLCTWSFQERPPRSGRSRVSGSPGGGSRKSQRARWDVAESLRAVAREAAPKKRERKSIPLRCLALG